jgi:shikimate 5-dehydrogenase
MTTLIQDESMSSGAIVIITILGLAMSYQSLSLTFSASNAIISGAGGSAGAALSGLTSMNSVSIISKVAATAATVAVLGATGGITLGGSNSNDD